MVAGFGSSRGPSGAELPQIIVFAVAFRARKGHGRGDELSIL